MLGCNRFVISGAIYARNLGDGIIAECLGYAIRRGAPQSAVVHADLSCRAGFSSSGSSSKPRLLRLLRKLPPSLSRAIGLLGFIAVYFKKIRNIWPKLFSKGDIVVIGGGHLLSDYYLNFPLKLAVLRKYYRGVNPRVCIYAVGVGENWSFLARTLFKGLVSDADYISVRDKQSKIFLHRHFPRLRVPVSVAPDPGYICEQVYRGVEPLMGGIGISISDSRELVSFQDPGAAESLNFDKFWIDLISHYARQQREVAVFSNGAEEDERYREYIRGLLPSDVLYTVEFPRAPSVPSDLVGMIKGLDLLISHRLHAHIVAFSHGVPSVAIGWDDKLVSQFELMGRRAFVADVADLNFTHVVALAAKAETTGVEKKAREALQKEAQKAIDEFLSSVYVS